MATTNALVELLIPQTDPNLDTVSVELKYAAETANFGALVVGAPGLFNSLGAGATNTIASYLANTCDRGVNHCIVNVYDVTAHLDGTPHGSPVATGDWTLSGEATGAPLPAQLSVCVSYKADYGSDVEFAPGTRPRARDRNRLYFGPFMVSAIAEGSSALRATVDPGLAADLMNNLAQMKFIDSGLDHWQLSTWSRKGANMKAVTEIWVDDVWDTQRRRGNDPGTRISRAI